MKIKFSRHANRRAKLYNISKSRISDILNNTKLSPGKHEIIKNIEGVKYPLKIVVVVDKNIITIITNYPLKKARLNESIL